MDEEKGLVESEEYGTGVVEIVSQILAQRRKYYQSAKKMSGMLVLFFTSCGYCRHKPYYCSRRF